MSDAQVKFTKEVFHNGSFQGLAQFGNQDFDNSDFAWDLTLFIARFDDFVKAYDKSKDSIIKKHSYEFPDPSNKGEVIIGLKPGSPQQAAAMEEIDRLNEQEFTIDLPKPVLTKDKLGKKINPTIIAKAAVFLDIRK